MTEPAPSTSSSSSPPPHPLAQQQEGYPFSSSALDTNDSTPPPSTSTSPLASPPRSPRHSSSYPNKARPLSPRPTSQSMTGVLSSSSNTASAGGTAQKKKHRASFDVHIPTLGLLSAAPGGAHTAGTIVAPTIPTEKYHRFPTRADDPEHNITVDQLSPGRRRVLEDCLKLFCSEPSLEILERSWNKDATFEDPIAKCHGFHEYAPQWFAMPKAFPQSKTLSLHLHNPSPSNPSEFIWEQVQEYTIRGLGTKKVVHSLVVVQLDENEKVLKFEDRWDAKELPTKYGTTFFRRLNAKVVPWLVSVPKKP